MKVSDRGPDSHYQPALDGLRAVVIIGVYVFHLAPDLLPGGHQAADVLALADEVRWDGSEDGTAQSTPRNSLLHLSYSFPIHGTGAARCGLSG